MQVKDLSVKMNFPPVNDKSKACQVTIENKSADTLEAADIEFLVASGQTVKGNDHFVVKRQDDTYVVGHLPKGVVLPAHSKYTFDLEVTPPLTSERHPEYFYIGFEGGAQSGVSHLCPCGMADGAQRGVREL